MFEVFSEWFGQSLSIPVITVDLFFIVIGVYAGLKMRKLRSCVYLMLGMVALYMVAAIVVNGPSYMFAIFAIYVGAIAVLIIAGTAIGLLIKKLKRTED